MIQRIQSVWLLLAGICAFFTIQFPISNGPSIENGIYKELTGGSSGTLILAVTILTGLIAGISIFLFKNRNMQLWLCIAGILSETLLIFLYYKKISETFSQTRISFGLVLHLAVILFFILAARGIYKDKKLIEDSDRLR